MIGNEVKVDVPLKWLDFLWALEESRHKSKDALTSNSDWFKLNPLEIVLLGCNSIINDGTAVLKISNVVVAIENIRPNIRQTPRIFHWLISHLCDLLAKDTVSTQLKQEIQKIFVGLFEISKHEFRLNLWLSTFLVELLHDRLRKKAFETFKLGQKSLQLISACIQDSLLNPNLELLICGKEILPLTIMKFLVEKYTFESVQQQWEDLRVGNIIKLIRVTSINVEETLHQFLLLFELTAFMNVAVANDKNDASTNAYDEPYHTDIPFHFALYSYIGSCLEMLKDLNPSGVPFVLLSYLFIENSIADYFKKKRTIETNEFDVFMFEYFFKYSMGGYSGCKLSLTILEKLIEFVASGIEIGMPKSTLVGVILPNLLAIGFEIGNEETKCLLLDYGSLACRSKHRSSLLSDSLLYIKHAHLLFKSCDEKEKEVNYVSKKLEAFEAVTLVIEDIIDQIIFPGNKCYTTDTITNKTPIAAIDESSSDNKIEYSAPTNQTNIKLILLNLLLDMTCHMIKHRENINFVLASVLPRLFQRTDYLNIPDRYKSFFSKEHIGEDNVKFSLSWNVSKEELAKDVFELCISCMQHSQVTPFQVCGVMIPKLVKNLDLTELDETMKLTILKEFVCLLKEESLAGNAIEMFLCYGLDIMSLLMPTRANDFTEIHAFIIQMSKSLHKLTQATSMLLLKTSCEFLLNNQHDEAELIKALYIFLIKKGNRNDIRNIYVVSKNWFLHERFLLIRKCIFQYPYGKIKSKDLQVISEILTSLMKCQEHLFLLNKDTKHMDMVLSNFVDPLLLRISRFLETNTFKSNEQEILRNEINNMSLYLVLFPEKVVHYLTVSNKESWITELEKNIPENVSKDHTMMKLLQVCAKRIEHMQIPRYEKLKQVLIKLFQDFCFCEANLKSSLTSEAMLVPDCQSGSDKIESEWCLLLYEKSFHEKLLETPWNQKKRERLILNNYMPTLWCFDDVVEITVETDGQLNLDENLRHTLLSCFAEYVELLKRLNILSVIVDGQKIQSENIFSDELSLVELKGRRAVVIKAIDKNTASQQQGSIMEKKSALLLQEENLEKAIQKMAKQPLKKRRFTAKLNISFFDCAKCCNTQIIGCYSPNAGEHCERPLEIGYRVDSAFASIYDNEGVEIENCEMLFTDQGVYMYKVYSSGHPYDTSDVWLKFLLEILEKRKLVPAIILPRDHPNRITWLALRRWVSPDVTGTLITCDFDCSSEWRTYYDSRPEIVGHGNDIILTKGFQDRERKTSFSFQRQISSNTNKDLAGMIFEFIIEKMLKDEMLKGFRFLGKRLVIFLNTFIENGHASSDLIGNHFDYEYWIKSQKTLCNTSKEEIIQKLVDFLFVNTEIYLKTLDLLNLWDTRLRQFLQLQMFVERNRKSKNPLKITFILQDKLTKILNSHLDIILIQNFNFAFQEELMHWIFDNEDRVWRYRGGRGGHETLSQYLRFLKPKFKSKKCFPGVLVCLRREKNLSLELINVKDVVAYAVGEYMYGEDEFDEQKEEQIPGDEFHTFVSKEQEKYYEIITAWVDPRFRGMQLSVALYVKIFKEVRSNTVLFDILQNTLQRILRSSIILSKIDKLGLSNFIVKNRTLSYDVVTENGENEQFERLIVSRTLVVACIYVFEFFHKFYIHVFLIVLSIFVNFAYNIFF